MEVDRDRGLAPRTRSCKPWLEVKVCLKRKHKHSATPTWLAAGRLLLLLGGRGPFGTNSQSTSAQDSQHRLNVIVLNTHHYGRVALPPEASGGGQPGRTEPRGQQSIRQTLGNIICDDRQHHLHKVASLLSCPIID